MKKILLMSGLLIAISGCTKIKQLANINVDIPYSASVTVPGIANDSGLPNLPVGTDLSFPSIAIATNSSQYLSEYHTSAGNIVNLYLKAMSIQITMPPGQNFDFMDSVQLYISAVSLPEVLVAYDYNIPKGQNTLTFYTLTNVNLKDYFLQDTMYLRLNTFINAIPPISGDQLNCSVTVHLTANPLD